MYKVKILIISNFITLFVSAQTRLDTVEVVDRMVDSELLSAIFKSDLVSILEYADNDSEIAIDHNQGESVFIDIWRLYLYGDAWNMQIEIYTPDNKLAELQVSKLFIEFKSSFEAKKFLTYFAPLANFNGPDEDGKYLRQIQTAEIYKDNSNVVFFWLSYPPVVVDSQKAIDKYVK